MEYANVGRVEIGGPYKPAGTAKDTQAAVCYFSELIELNIDGGKVAIRAADRKSEHDLPRNA
jgi:hypothetical protein